MDDPSEPRVEIFAPFGEAFELTKKILFEPFDLAKWFVIGFAAWLATFFNGGFGFNYPRGWGNKDWGWHWRSQHGGAPFSIHNLSPWVVPAVVVGLGIFLVLLVIVLWLNSRGRFMFTDCIVRNRGAIAEPWREFRNEGNGFFVFRLVIALCSLVVFGGLALLFFINCYWHHMIVPLALLILAAVFCGLLALVVAFLTQFMVPVMYRQRCDALSAFRRVSALIVARPVSFLLFGLFCLVLYLAAAMIGCLAACFTCCIAALPYLGTVILLPVVMFLFAYPLCFLRQFGDPYDVWAVVRPPELPQPPMAPPPSGEPPAIPPIQEPPSA